MNIDITSFFFNSTIEGATATCAWGTSIGQSKSKECRIETDVLGVNDFLAGLVYKSKSDTENFDLSKGSKNREYLIRAIFDKVFVNGTKVKDKSFIVLLARENTASHSGRLIISYPPYASYKSDDVYVSNEATITEMFKVLECNDSGCWFSYDISVINQDELHFSCVVVNKDQNMVYRGKSSERSAEWASLIPDAEHRNFVVKVPSSPTASHQIIYYGAPGTGKSHKIKEQLEGVSKENIFRTTFHPDSDYSTFVGAYKPIMKKQYRYEGKVKASYYEDDDLAGAKKGDPVIEKAIEYSFVPQAFLNAYIQAYKKPEEKVYLIIEEINRGNCAQIFGDLFQLLDRDENGISEYTIKADADLKAFLEDELGEDNPGIKDGELCLPSNLYIYATMNTSDQSLFPIDSAFKRRWDWEYEPIKYKNTDWKIVIVDIEYSWTSFQRKVNDKILSATSSEDKMLGDYFVNPSDGVITDKVLLNKILFYLWNDVCKDGEGDIFRIKEGDKEVDITFSDLYGTDKSDKLRAMMNYLQVEVAEDEGRKDEELENLVDSASKIKVNGKSVKYINVIPYMAIKEYVSLHPEKTSQEILDIWSPFKKYSMRSWVVCNKQERDSMKPEYANYSLEINCTDGQSIWVNKDGWMHNPTKQRDTIAEFIDAVNESGLGISITETSI